MFPLWPVSLLFVFSPGQDWYVDANAPGCPSSEHAPRHSGGPTDPFCTIQEAVDAASGGDTIHIAPGLYVENVLIEKDLDLIGTRGEAATILDGAASGSVVRVRDAAVSLTGLTLTNGTGTVDGDQGPRGGGLLGYSPLGLATPVTLSRCSVIRNRAKSGGGIAGEGTPLILINSTVSGNVCGLPGAGRGGGIWSDDTLVLEGSTVSDNQAHLGGGIFAFGPVILSGSKVRENTVLVSLECPARFCIGGMGGGILFNDYINPGSSLTLESSSVEVNYAAIGGGGIWSTGPTSISGSTVSGNRAFYQGGGLMCYGATDLVGSRISGNSALNGGGIHFSTGLMTLTNSTVTGNYSDALVGGGIKLLSAGLPTSAVLKNSILWSNGRSPLFLQGTDPSATVDHTLIEGGWPGTGNLDADPLFIDAMDGDFRLLPGSPCIDAGDNLAVPMDLTTDIRGVPRVVDGVVDMGAYEFFRRIRDARNAPPRKLR